MPQTKLQHLATRRAVPFDPALLNAATVLVIDAPEALGLLKPKPGQQSVVMTRKSLISAQMIANVQPDAVIAPLIARDWDIVDLGMSLEAQGYKGLLFAMTQPLPRAELVLREVSALCSSLRVRLLETC